MTPIHLSPEVVDTLTVAYAGTKNVPRELFEATSGAAKMLPWLRLFNNIIVHGRAAGSYFFTSTNAVAAGVARAGYDVYVYRQNHEAVFVARRTGYLTVVDACCPELPVLDCIEIGGDPAAATCRT